MADSTRKGWEAKKKLLICTVTHGVLIGSADKKDGYEIGLDKLVFQEMEIKASQQRISN